MKYFWLLAFAVTTCSCWGKRENFPDPDYYKKVMGWKPVYAADSVSKKLTVYNNAQAVENAGKILVFGNYIFQNDFGKGIHVIDNSSPANAHRIAFWSLPGNTELSVKGNFMYVNNYNDLVVIDISNRTTPVIVNRLKNTFYSADAQYPYPWQAPPEAGYFECPKYNNDSIVVSWVKDSVQKFCFKP